MCCPATQLSWLSDDVWFIFSIGCSQKTFRLCCPWRPCWYLWFPARARGLAGVGGQCSAPVHVEARELCVLLWSGLPLEPKLVSMVRVATGGHVDVCELYCHLRPYSCLWSILLPRALLGSVVLLQSGAMWMCYHQKPYRCAGSVMQPESMLMSIVCVAIGGHVDVCGLCCSQGSC